MDALCTILFVEFHLCGGISANMEYVIYPEPVPPDGSVEVN
jgi:hypothetical protein